MNVHTWIRQTRFVNGILGVSLFLFGACPYGWAADEPATGELLAGRSQGAAPVLSRDIASEGESAWEDYAGMIAAATTVPCCDGGACAEIPPEDCSSAAGTVVCACLGDVDPVNGVDDACELCEVANTALAEPMQCSGNGDCDEATGSCSVEGICECLGDGDCWNLASCINGVCYVPKNRYITFEPNNAGRCVALRVEMTASDTFPACTFTGKWVGEPNPATGVSRVVDVPIYRNWTEPVVYVGDLEIVPASTYEVSAIEQACDPEDPSKYSAPLILPTVPIPTTCADSCVAPCPWADIVGIQVPPGIYLPPDGKVDFDDIVAMIEAILDDPNAPPITWTDLMREVPNGRIDIRDLIAIDDVCRSTDLYFTDYPGASPCGTGRTHQPPKAEDSLRADTTLECRLYDEYGNLLIRDLAGLYQAIPSQIADVEMFLKDVLELRGYKVALDVARNGGSVADWIFCPDGVDIDPDHRVCAGTRENCYSDDDCIWCCVGGDNPGDACDQDAECDGGACISGSCVGGGNPGAECDPDVDCLGGVCDDAPKVCVGGDNHGEFCGDSLECEGGDGCKTCTKDFAFYGSLLSTIARPRCESYFFEIEGSSDPTDLGDTPPGYLGTFTLNVPGDVGGRTFNIEIMPDTGRSEEPEETTYFLTSLENANDDSIYFEYDEPCAVLSVLPDCNLNGMPDQCDIGDEVTCATPLCQSYTGSGRPECGQSTDCQPEGVRGHGIPDECDIAASDGGLCEGEGGQGEEDCSWDCQLNQVPDECEADCSSDGCPDDCEWMDRTVQGQSCGQPIAEEDCDSDGTCNVDEISEANNGACTGEDCSSDCHVYCYDPEEYKPWCDPYVGIPDECDIGDCPGCDLVDPDCHEEDCQDCDENSVPDWCDINVACASTCCEDCDGNRVPDICDLRDCAGDVSCDDCNDNGVLDGCEIPVSLGGLCDAADPAACLNCDINGNGLPDRCECPGASDSGACENAFSGAATDAPTLEAALEIELLDGTPQEYAGLSGSGAIVRGTPHFHGDVPPEPSPDEPCMVPYAFPEPLPGDFARSREIHFMIDSLELGTCPGGPCLTLGATPSLGEAQGMCLDFPGDSFVNLFIEFNTGSEILHTETPLVVRAELSDPAWGWGFTSLREIFVNDHSAPAIPLLDDTNLHRGYLTRLQLGEGAFADDSDPCEAARAIAGPVSFVVGSDTQGLESTLEHDVYYDREVAAKKVRVYVSSRTPPQAPDTTNIRDDVLVGFENPPDGFWSYDQITSVSFGTDGTLSPTRGDVAPIIYFSVDGGSVGAACTDVERQVALYGSTATDVYSSPSPHFGSYEVASGALPPACGAMRGNCLVVDQTALGLGPYGTNGLVDDVLGLEMADFDAGAGDLAYLTFLEPSFGGDSATIWVYDCLGDPATNPFEADNLQPYATAADLGLKAGDEIDALAVSDNGTGQPNGLWEEGDEVLISLARGSPTLDDNGWSGAHIFRIRFEDTGPIEENDGFVFLAPGDLGLTPGDDIDAIDVGAGMVFSDCNKNGIDDACDVARGFSEDVGANGVPDECETPCSFTCARPNPELMPDPPFPNAVNEKVRYLSFIGGGPGERQAIRVTFVDLPAPFDMYNGEAMWVGPPQTYCENAGQTTPPAEGCGPAPGLPLTWLASTLQCEPYYAEWQGLCSPCVATCLGSLRHGEPCAVSGDCAETIHVSHSAIVPGGVYHLDAIDRLCPDVRIDLSYSDPLPLTTSRWGDLVENCTVVPCGPPEGVVNVTTDVTALLDKWKNLPGCVMKARADIEGKGTGDGSAPDQLINITDVTLALDAFKGFAYPFEPSPPPPCP